MNSRREIFCFLLLMSFMINDAVIGQTSDKPGFEEFRLIWERNIFDPARREPQRETRAPQRVETPPPEEIRLLGVLLTAKESAIFFEGSKSSYTGEWKRGDMIAGFRIIEAKTTGVVLESGKQNISLPVGSVMKRSGDATWRISSSESYSAQHQDKKKTSSPEEKISDAGDILKRLMERRKREMEQ